MCWLPVSRDHYACVTRKTVSRDHYACVGYQFHVIIMRWLPVSRDLYVCWLPVSRDRYVCWLPVSRDHYACVGYQFHVIIVRVPMHVQHDRLAEPQNQVRQPLRVHELRVEAPEWMVSQHDHLKHE